MSNILQYLILVHTTMLQVNTIQTGEEKYFSTQHINSNNNIIERRGTKGTKHCTFCILLS